MSMQRGVDRSSALRGKMDNRRRHGRHRLVAPHAVGPRRPTEANSDDSTNRGNGNRTAKSSTTANILFPNTREHYSYNSYLCEPTNPCENNHNTTAHKTQPKPSKADQSEPSLTQCKPTAGANAMCNIKDTSKGQGRSARSTLSSLPFSSAVVLSSMVCLPSKGMSFMKLPHHLNRIR